MRALPERIKGGVSMLFHDKTNLKQRFLNAAGAINKEMVAFFPFPPPPTSYPLALINCAKAFLSPPAPAQPNP